MIRVRGGGKHTDKKSKTEKRQEVSAKKPEPSKEKEAESQLEQNTDKLDGNRDAETQSTETQRSNSFGNIDFSQPSGTCQKVRDQQVEDQIQQYLIKLKNSSQVNMMETAIRSAVEAERKEKVAMADLETRQEGKKVNGTKEPDVKIRSRGMREDKRLRGPVKGGEDGHKVNETCGKGKGKGNGSEGQQQHIRKARS